MNDSNNWQNTQNAGNENQFLKNLVHIILDECKIVGSGNFVKENNEKLIDFKQPQELEVIFL